MMIQFDNLLERRSSFHVYNILLRQLCTTENLWLHGTSFGLRISLLLAFKLELLNLPLNLQHNATQSGWLSVVTKSQTTNLPTWFLLCNKFVKRQLFMDFLQRAGISTVWPCKYFIWWTHRYHATKDHKMLLTFPLKKAAINIYETVEGWNREGENQVSLRELRWLNWLRSRNEYFCNFMKYFSWFSRPK